MCAWSSNIVKPAKFQIIISSLTVQFSSSNIAKSKCLLEKLTLVQFHYLIIIACDFEHDIFHFLLSDIESKITYSFTHYFQLGPKCVVDLQKKNKMISINIIFAFSKIWPGQKFGIFERVVRKLSSGLESVQLLF